MLASPPRTRHWPLGQRCGFDKGSISVTQGVFGGSGAIRAALCFQLVADPEIPVTAASHRKCSARVFLPHLEPSCALDAASLLRSRRTAPGPKTHSLDRP